MAGIGSVSSTTSPFRHSRLNSQYVPALMAVSTSWSFMGLWNYEIMEL